MMTICSTLARLSDGELVAEVKRLAARECQATAHLVASLAELDARRVYLGQGYSSLFTYCTGALGLSDYVARNIIRLMLRGVLCGVARRITRPACVVLLRYST
jgi:hypothetical protein